MHPGLESPKSQTWCLRMEYLRMDYLYTLTPRSTLSLYPRHRFFMPDKLEPEALLEEPGSGVALLEMAALKRWMLGDSRAGTEAMQSVRDTLTMCIGLVEISIGLHGIALVMCMVIMLRVRLRPAELPETN